MATFKAGRVFVDPYGLIMINTLILDPSTQNQQTRRNIVWDASEAKCINFKKITADMGFTLILYNPNAVEEVQGNYSKYTGELYILPLDIREFPHEVELDPYISSVKVFILVLTNTSANRYWGRKIEYLYPRHDVPLMMLRGLLSRTFNGEGTMQEVITPLLYDNIPINHPASGGEKPVNTELLSSELEKYKIPAASAGTDFNLLSFGRPLDWNKSVEENRLSKNETVSCRLYRRGNKLTAYPGSEKTDFGFMAFDAFLDILIDSIGGAI